MARSYIIYTCAAIPAAFCHFMPIHVVGKSGYLILLLSQIGLLLQWKFNNVFLLYGRRKYVAVR
jgi:hypothetical protein